ncbi:hypothetical protein V8F20_010286 [Naviculisporaceae sp. PSN 640]
MSGVLARGVGSQSSIESVHYLLQLSATPRLLARPVILSCNGNGRSERWFRTTYSGASDEDSSRRPRRYKLVSKDTAPEDWPTVDDVKQRITARNEHRYGWRGPYGPYVYGDSFPSFVRYRSPAWEYRPTSQRWTNTIDPGDSLSPQSPPLEPGTEFQIAVWNVDWQTPSPEVRICLLIEHIREEFNYDECPPLVIMLQEVSRKCMPSLQANEWLQQNFYISEARIDPDTVLSGGCLPGERRPQVRWGNITAHCITLISKRLPRPMITTVQFGSWVTLYNRFGTLGTHVSLADLPVFGSGILRLANTRFTPGGIEDSENSRFTRFRQLRETSALLSASRPSSPVVAAVLGGDFNIKSWTEARDNLAPLSFRDAYFRNGWGARRLYQRTGHSFIKDRILYRGHIDGIYEPQKCTIGAAWTFGDRLYTELDALELTKSDEHIPPYYITPQRAARLEKENPNGVFGRGGRSGRDDIYYTLPAVKTKRIFMVSDHRCITAKFKLGDYRLPKGLKPDDP